MFENMEVVLIAWQVLLCEWLFCRGICLDLLLLRVSPRTPIFKTLTEIGGGGWGQKHRSVALCDAH